MGVEPTENSRPKCQHKVVGDIYSGNMYVAPELLIRCQLIQLLKL